MKKILMAIITLIIMIAISATVIYANIFSESGKKNIEKEEAALNKTEDNSNEKDESEVILNKIEEKAKNEIKEKQTMTDEEINEAILYIESNIELPSDLLTQDNIEKIAYYGAYLKNIIEYSEGEEKNEISILGETTFEYSKEALKFINKNQEENTLKITAEEAANQENTEIETSEEETNQVNSEIAEENNELDKTEGNIIKVNTSTTLENAKTKVKEVLLKINNNKNTIIQELKDKLNQSNTEIETQE